MAYVPTNWKNREVERPRTFTVIENSDGTITLVPAEGTVTEQGTPIVAVNMNKIEQGIVNAIPKSEKGKPNGVPTLDATGKVPAAQMGVSTPSDASLTVKGIVRLNNSLTSMSVTEAATPSAVAAVNAKLNDTGWINMPVNTMFWSTVGVSGFCQYRIKNGMCTLRIRLEAIQEGPYGSLVNTLQTISPSQMLSFNIFAQGAANWMPIRLIVQSGNINILADRIFPRYGIIDVNMTYPLG